MNPSDYRDIVLFDNRAKKEFDSLSKEFKAKFYYIVELLKKAGIGIIHRPHIAPLSKGLREMRLITKQGHARALYVLKKGKLAILRVFKKKTREVPAKETSIALERQSRLAEEYFDVADMMMEDFMDPEIRKEYEKLTDATKFICEYVDVRGGIRALGEDEKESLVDVVFKA